MLESHNQNRGAQVSRKGSFLMENLQPNSALIKTPDDAIEWMRGVQKRGEYPQSSVANCCTALAAYQGVKGEDEPNTVQWYLDNLDKLARRWATKNSGSGEALNYRSRAKRILTEYVRFLDDPVSFTPVTRPRKNGTRPSTQETPVARNAGVQEAVREEQGPGVHRVHLPIHDGESVLCEWRGSFTVKDVDRFAYLLRGFASDFGLASPDVG